MRKPLAVLGLALTASLGAIPAADALAAPTASSPLDTRSPASYSQQLPPAPPSSPLSSSNAVSGAQIIQTALQYLGYPYTATGNSPATGFSCIGFVSYVYRANGIQLPGDLGGAIAYAPQVPFSELQPGDILYFKNTFWTGLSHAAIYLGGGRFVHAENYGAGVRISSFNNDKYDYNYWIAHYLGANRPWGGAAVTPVIGSPPPPPAVGFSASTPGASAVQPAAGGVPAVVTAPSLNVRSAPSRAGAVQSVVAQGTSITIIGRSGRWVHVQLADGSQGWVMRAYISRGAGSTPTPVASAQTNPNIGNPTAPVRAGAPAAIRPRVAARVATTQMRVTGVRIHTAPSVGAPVETTTFAGQRLRVIAHSNGWMEVRLPSGQVGWVVASFTAGVHRTGGQVQATRQTQTPAQIRTRVTTGGASTQMRVSGVRIHTSPAISAPVETSTYAGQRLQVIARSNGWMEVRLPSGQVGWLVASYTSGARQSTAPRTTYAARQTRLTVRRSYAGGSVLSAGVRVHSAPGLSSRVVGMAIAGTHVQVLGRGAGWTLVRLPSGQVGYVYSAYVRK